MNIFILDESPIKAAQLQCDKHVVKMIVESAQMLSTAHRLLDGVVSIGVSKSGRKAKQWFHPKHDDLLYKAVHMGHPCTVWTMESVANYIWHYDHFMSLCYEYQYRYGKVHATQTRLEEVLSIPPRNIPIDGLTPFRLAMGVSPECLDESNPVLSYRKFYQTKQARFKMTWTKREVPDWFQCVT